VKGKVGRKVLICITKKKGKRGGRTKAIALLRDIKKVAKARKLLRVAKVKKMRRKRRR